MYYGYSLTFEHSDNSYYFTATSCNDGVLASQNTKFCRDQEAPIKDDFQYHYVQTHQIDCFIDAMCSSGSNHAGE